MGKEGGREGEREKQLLCTKSWTRHIHSQCHRKSLFGDIMHSVFSR